MKPIACCLTALTVAALAGCNGSTATNATAVSKTTSTSGTTYTTATRTTAGTTTTKSETVAAFMLDQETITVAPGGQATVKMTGAGVTPVLAVEGNNEVTASAEGDTLTIKAGDMATGDATVTVKSGDVTKIVKVTVK